MIRRNYRSKIAIRRRDRASGLLGLIGLIALLSTLCVAVSISSMRSAIGSGRGVQRLQTLAAAEGAMAMMQSGDATTSGVLTIGDCRVRISPTSDQTTATTAAQLTVGLIAGNRIAFSQKFHAKRDANDQFMLEVGR